MKLSPRPRHLVSLLLVTLGYGAACVDAPRTTDPLNERTSVLPIKGADARPATTVARSPELLTMRGLGGRIYLVTISGSTVTANGRQVEATPRFLNQLRRIAAGSRQREAQRKRAALYVQKRGYVSRDSLDFEPARQLALAHASRSSIDSAIRAIVRRARPARATTGEYSQPTQEVQHSGPYVAEELFSNDANSTEEGLAPSAALAPNCLDFIVAYDEEMTMAEFWLDGYFSWSNLGAFCETCTAAERADYMATSQDCMELYQEHLWDAQYWGDEFDACVSEEQ